MYRKPVPGPTGKYSVELMGLHICRETNMKSLNIVINVLTHTHSITLAHRLALAHTNTLTRTHKHTLALGLSCVHTPAA